MCNSNDNDSSSSVDVDTVLDGAGVIMEWDCKHPIPQSWVLPLRAGECSMTTMGCFLGWMWMDSTLVYSRMVVARFRLGCGCMYCGYMKRHRHDLLIITYY